MSFGKTLSIYHRTLLSLSFTKKALAKKSKMAYNLQFGVTKKTRKLESLSLIQPTSIRLTALNILFGVT